MPLTAAELTAHPAYPHLAWRLKPTSHGPLTIPDFPYLQLYHQIHGTGPTRILFIMGLGAYHTAWKRQTRHFGHVKGSEYEVCVFDNRGVGLSGKPYARMSTKVLAGDVVGLLERVGWLVRDSSEEGGGGLRVPKNEDGKERKLNVVGVSMGGMIAQELALLLPEGVLNSLILCSTAPRLVRTVPFVQNLRQRINMFVPRDVDVQLDEISSRLFSDEFLEREDTEADEEYTGGPEGGNFPTNKDRYAAGELEKRRDKEGFTRMGFMLQAIAAGWHHKSKAQLEQIVKRVGKGRVVACHGTGDRMIEFVHAEMLKEELGLRDDGVEWKVWEGKGHVLMWEAEKEFNAWVEDVIRRCEAMNI